jgi:hypothetical protein
MRDDLEDVIREYEAEKNTKLTIKQGPGLYMKIPFLQKVILLEDRILEYDSEPTDIVTRDKKHLLLDNFARWRIVNPLSKPFAPSKELRPGSMTSFTQSFGKNSPRATSWKSCARRIFHPCLKRS